MGKFANEGPGQGLRIGPRVEVKGTDGFDAMGKPIPYYRQQAGYEHCKQMGLDSERSFSVVGIMSEKLARDEPHAGMEAALKYLDVTGVYRLMAVLLTAERKTE